MKTILIFFTFSLAALAQTSTWYALGLDTGYAANNADFAGQTVQWWSEIRITNPTSELRSVEIAAFRDDGAALAVDDPARTLAAGETATVRIENGSEKYSGAWATVRGASDLRVTVQSVCLGGNRLANYPRAAETEHDLRRSRRFALRAGYSLGVLNPSNERLTLRVCSSWGRCFDGWVNPHGHYVFRPWTASGTVNVTGDVLINQMDGNSRGTFSSYSVDSSVNFGSVVK